MLCLSQLGNPPLYEFVNSFFTSLDNSPNFLIFRSPLSLPLNSLLFLGLSTFTSSTFHHTLKRIVPTLLAFITSSGMASISPLL